MRDNVLAVSGRLDSTIGGPDLDPELGQTSGRRSLYFRHAKEKRMTFLRLFDSPNVTACYRRTRERRRPSRPSPWRTAPLSRDQARRLARDLAASLERIAGRPGVRSPARSTACWAASPQPKRTRSASTTCRTRLDSSPSRRSSPHSRGGSRETLKAAEAALGRARENLVHVLFNHNDFITIR